MTAPRGCQQGRGGTVRLLVFSRLSCFLSGISLYTDLLFSGSLGNGRGRESCLKYFEKPILARLLACFVHCRPMDIRRNFLRPCFLLFFSFFPEWSLRVPIAQEDKSSLYCRTSSNVSLMDVYERTGQYAPGRRPGANGNLQIFERGFLRYVRVRYRFQYKSIASGGCFRKYLCNWKRMSCPVRPSVLQCGLRSTKSRLLQA